MANTYSFSDVNIVMNFIGLAPIVANGQGIGEITIEPMNDVTVHDLAADGTVMPSKIAAPNATISVTVQQTSRMHTALQAAYNYLVNAPSAQWAANSINISTLPIAGGMLDNYNLTGVSFQRRASQPYQQQGQRVTWQFMATNNQSFAPSPSVPLAQTTVNGTIV